MSTAEERAEAWKRIPEDLHRRASALSRQLMRLPAEDHEGNGEPPETEADNASLRSAGQSGQ